jgi:hypothetical protein
MHVVEPLSVRQNVDVDLVFVIHILSCRRKVPKVIAIKLDLKILLQSVLKLPFVARHPRFDGLCHQLFRVFFSFEEFSEVCCLQLLFVIPFVRAENLE